MGDKSIEKSPEKSAHGSGERSRQKTFEKLANRSRHRSSSRTGNQSGSRSLKRTAKKPKNRSCNDLAKRTSNRILKRSVDKSAHKSLKELADRPLNRIRKKLSNKREGNRTGGWGCMRTARNRPRTGVARGNSDCPGARRQSGRRQGIGFFKVRGSVPVRTPRPGSALLRMPGSRLNKEKRPGGSGRFNPRGPLLSCDRDGLHDGRGPRPVLGAGRDPLERAQDVHAFDQSRQPG